MAGIQITGVPPNVLELDTPPISPMLRPNGAGKIIKCPPDFSRCTLTAIPQSQALLTKSQIPFGLIINPYKLIHESNVDLIEAHRNAKEDPDEKAVAFLPVVGPTNRDPSCDRYERVFDGASIVRCRRCRAYINPYVEFVDNSHWRCNLCFLLNEGK